jgi:uncharacterized 2Fe-2S/4Fe-4S cluster protein (DUF4445 family)
MSTSDHNGDRSHWRFQVMLKPTGTRIGAVEGAALKDLLFEHGVEFPCGGQGRCRGCRVRILGGHVDVDSIERERLTGDEIASGWRLACRCFVRDNITVELRQWDGAILGDDTEFTFTPGVGFGVAVDIGTTTIVAQLLDLSSARVLAVRSSLNPQSQYGADVMSRIEYAVENSAVDLTRLVRERVGALIGDMLASSEIDRVRLVRVVLVGNTVMHHLFCGIDVEPLSHVPFEPVDDDLRTMNSLELGWTEFSPATRVEFLPSLGGFVGSDILAGIVATGIAESDELRCLIDLGTNGEMVLGNRERMLCASTAAGPAFEGARINCGMRASAGAIHQVEVRDGKLACRTLGGETAKGVCGSGLVDAVAAALEMEMLTPAGRICASDRRVPLVDGIALTQTDIRQLQLAKGAITAGIHILLKEFGAAPADVTRVDLAGAFGNYIRIGSARRIGLLPFSTERVGSAGNTALLGAKIALFHDCAGFDDLRERVRHVSLHADVEFQETYVSEMAFPERHASE